MKDGTEGSRSKSQTKRNGSDDDEAEVSKPKRNKSISFNPNLQSYRDLGHSSDSKVQPFIDESQRFMEDVSFDKKAEKIKAQTTRLSMSVHEIEMRKKEEKVPNDLVSADNKADGSSQSKTLLGSTPITRPVHEISDSSTIKIAGSIP